jgi:anti-anti-sigma regulatory factor
LRIGRKDYPLAATFLFARRYLVARRAHRIELAGDLGLRDAESLRRQLLDTVAVHKSVEIATGGLTAIDVSVIQLLIGAQKFAKARKQRLTIAAPADGPLRAAVERAGLLAASGGSPLEINWHGRDAAS